MTTVEEHLIAKAPPEQARRWRRLIPDALHPITHPGVHQVLENVMALDAALMPALWKELTSARSVHELRRQYRALVDFYTVAPASNRSVPRAVDKVDTLLHFLQQHAAPLPDSEVSLPTLHERCQWMWIASTLHAAFTHPMLSELGRLRQGKPPRN
ncbi:MAG: hypothetical protein R6U20_13425 [Longimonas sp.]|uniref:hypothetical protein n=1 Tax=Longimonas sp. TaxID=2039626 RepID=UPI00397506C8